MVLLTRSPTRQRSIRLVRDWAGHRRGARVRRARRPMILLTRRPVRPCSIRLVRDRARHGRAARASSAGRCSARTRCSGCESRRRDEEHAKKRAHPEQFVHLDLPILEDVFERTLASSVRSEAGCIKTSHARGLAPVADVFASSIDHGQGAIAYLSEARSSVEAMRTGQRPAPVEAEETAVHPVRTTS